MLLNSQPSIRRLILFVFIKLTVHVNQVPVAVYAFFFHTLLSGTGRIDGQHGASLIRDMQKITMAFLALCIFKSCIGMFTAFFPVIGAIGEMDEYIFDAVSSLGVKEIDRILRGRQMAVHTVSDKPLGIVYMGGGFPTVIGGSNFVTGRTETGSGRSGHGIISEAENRGKR